MWGESILLPKNVSWIGRISLWKERSCAYLQQWVLCCSVDMSCCRCRNGICVDCKCAFVSRFCTNCSSPQCTNKHQNQQAALKNQKAALVNVLQLTSTESVSADSCEKTSSDNQEGTLLLLVINIPQVKRGMYMLTFDECMLMPLCPLLEYNT